jgi:hypothetical protein
MLPVGEFMAIFMLTPMLITLITLITLIKLISGRKLGE